MLNLIEKWSLHTVLHHLCAALFLAVVCCRDCCPLADVLEAVAPLLAEPWEEVELLSSPEPGRPPADKHQRINYSFVTSRISNRIRAVFLYVCLCVWPSVSTHDRTIWPLTLIFMIDMRHFHHVSVWKSMRWSHLPTILIGSSIIILFKKCNWTLTESLPTE